MTVTTLLYLPNSPCLHSKSRKYEPGVKPVFPTEPPIAKGGLKGNWTVPFPTMTETGQRIYLGYLPHPVFYVIFFNVSSNSTLYGNWSSTEPVSVIVGNGTVQYPFNPPFAMGGSVEKTGLKPGSYFLLFECKQGEVGRYNSVVTVTSTFHIASS